MSSLKRKKYSKDIRCVFFPDDVRSSVDPAAGSSLGSSASKSWKRCGESFLDIPQIKSSGKTLSAVRKLDRASLSVHDSSFGHHDNDPLDISWTSSESEQSDKESSNQVLAKAVPLKRHERQKKLQRPTARPLHALRAGEVPQISSHKDPVSIDWTSSSESELSDNDHDLSLANAMAPRHQERLRNPLRQAAAVKHSNKVPADTEDLPIFDSDSDLKSSGDQLKPDSMGHISECESPPHAVNKAPKAPMPSSDPDVSDWASGGGVAGADAGPPGRPEPRGAASGRPVSDWARVAQALLHTPPRKTPGSQSKTPEDSVKKKRKLKSGGLAERLNRLQCRQRSSFSFWRHLSVSQDSDSVATAVRPGVLVLEVLEVQQECSMQLARCQPRLPPSEGNATITAAAHLLVLFNRETAAQLRPAPKDVIHVYPPWQKLDIEDGNTTVILNTHFSQKVCAKVTDTQTPRSLLPPAKCPPYSLTHTFGLHEVDAVKWRDDKQVGNSEGVAVGGSEDTSWTPGGHSLLELIEGLGRAGPAGPDVQVVVQRVWSAYVPDRPMASAVKPRAPPSAAAPPPRGRSRLCALVQDRDGIFGVLQLQVLACDQELQRCTHRWQGRGCTLRSLKVLQRVTRQRCGRVFRLIDSVWPPTLPSKGGGPGAAPCFYYLLSGREDSLEAGEGPASSPLYVPPKHLTLREVLESAGRVSCCSFTATVVHASITGDTVGQMEGWLVVSDHSLQEEQHEGGISRRTVPVRIDTSCVLPSAVAGAICSPVAAILSFRDVLRENGALLCAEHSVVRTLPAPPDRVDRSVLTGPAPLGLPRPVRLDPLGPDTPANSLCTLGGVIVGVDEATARSWPVCSICGSNRLEVAGVGKPLTYHCLACSCQVEKPGLRLRLEVTLASAVIHGTVKAKLHQTTIQSILNTAALHVDEFPGYEVEHVLGKAVGPIPAFVRVVRRTPALWFGVEEISL